MYRSAVRGVLMLLLSVLVGGGSGLAPGAAAHATGQHQWGALYVYWNWSGDGFWNVDQNVRIDRKAASTYWALNFTWTDDHTSGGYIGLQTNGVRPDGTSGEMALFSLWNANAAQGPHCQRFGGEGVGYQCKLAYRFQTGRLYRYRVWRLERDSGGQWWGGWIKDQATGVENYLGRIRVPGGHTLIHSPMNFVEYFGPAVPCDRVPVSDAIFTQPAANHQGGGTYQYGSTFRSWNRASCTGGWAGHYRFGATVGARAVMGGPR